VFASRDALSASCQFETSNKNKAGREEIGPGFVYLRLTPRRPIGNFSSSSPSSPKITVFTDGLVADLIVLTEPWAKRFCAAFVAAQLRRLSLVGCNRSAKLIDSQSHAIPLSSVIAAEE